MSEEPEEIISEEEEVEVEVKDPIQEMELRINELEKEIKYSAAEVVNIRQRSIRDKNDAVKYGSANLASKELKKKTNLRC